MSNKHSKTTPYRNLLLSLYVQQSKKKPARGNFSHDRPKQVFLFLKILLCAVAHFHPGTFSHTVEMVSIQIFLYALMAINTVYSRASHLAGMQSLILEAFFFNSVLDIFSNRWIIWALVNDYISTAAQ